MFSPLSFEYHLVSHTEDFGTLCHGPKPAQAKRLLCCSCSSDQHTPWPFPKAQAMWSCYSYFLQISSYYTRANGKTQLPAFVIIFFLQLLEYKRMAESPESIAISALAPLAEKIPA